MPQSSCARRALSDRLWTFGRSSWRRSCRARSSRQGSPSSGPMRSALAPRRLPCAAASPSCRRRGPGPRRCMNVGTRSGRRSSASSNARKPRPSRGSARSRPKGCRSGATPETPAPGQSRAVPRVRQSRAGRTACDRPRPRLPMLPRQTRRCRPEAAMAPGRPEGRSDRQSRVLREAPGAARPERPPTSWRPLQHGRRSPRPPEKPLPQPSRPQWWNPATTKRMRRTRRKRSAGRSPTARARQTANRAALVRPRASRRGSVLPEAPRTASTVTSPMARATAASCRGIRVRPKSARRCVVTARTLAAADRAAHLWPRASGRSAMLWGARKTAIVVRRPTAAATEAAGQAAWAATGAAGAVGATGAAAVTGVAGAAGAAVGVAAAAAPEYRHHMRRLGAARLREPQVARRRP
mmetsp:Transcript_55807/g.161617  ORF Transcript_55807/g.161617 Transcript_55807/m.161617 type:complete len:410 (-) Transcript_55807:484-1713(-)